MPRQRAGCCVRRRERAFTEFPQTLTMDLSTSMPGSCKSKGTGLAKTKLCKYHILGQCAKGRACSFAHDANEMKVAIDAVDTSHAKVCRNLINTGRCDELSCPYAHSRKELLEKPVGPLNSRLDQATRLCLATFTSDAHSKKSGSSDSNGRRWAASIVVIICTFSGLSHSYSELSNSCADSAAVEFAVVT